MRGLQLWYQKCSKKETSVLIRKCAALKGRLRTLWRWRSRWGPDNHHHQTIEYFYGKIFRCWFIIVMILRALSCKWFILVFEDLWQNIQINGQYANCDSIKAFINVLLRSKLKYLQTLATASIGIQKNNEIVLATPSISKENKSTGPKNVFRMSIQKQFMLLYTNLKVLMTRLIQRVKSIISLTWF